MATQLRTRRRTKRKGNRVWLIVLFLLCICGAAAAWFYFFRAPSTSVQEDTGPETVAVFPQLYRETVSGTGTLEPTRTLSVGFDVAGTITNIAQVGQRVSAEDTLASLNPSSFERSLRDAEFALEQAITRLSSTASSQSDSQVNLLESIASSELSLQDATREVERSQAELELKQKLQQAGGESTENVQLAQDAYTRALDNLSKAELNLETLKESQSLRVNANQQDLRNSELSVQAAELSLERAQEDLNASTLRAPFSGIIASLESSEGNTVNANAAVLTLIDDSKVILEAQVDETEISLVSLGLLADVELDAVPDKVFSGEVTTISPVARLVSSIPIFDVTITLDNSEGLMRPGMTAEAEILIREVEGTVSVPSRALETARNRTYVRVLGEDGEAALQPVRVVTTSGLNTIVQASLDAGTEVLLPEQVVTEEAATANTGGGFRLPFVGGGRR